MIELWNDINTDMPGNNSRQGLHKESPVTPNWDPVIQFVMTAEIHSLRI
jgi:hypothetical protein